MKNLQKIIFGLFITGFFTANNLFSSYYDLSSNDYEQGHEVNEYQMIGAYNAPATPDLKGSLGCFVKGSFILWEAREKGLDTAIQLLNTTSFKTINMPFSYKPGFKVGIGTNFSNNWNLLLQYTGYFAKQHKKANADNNTIFLPCWVLPTTDLTIPTAFFSNNQWTLDFNIIDAEIGRPFYIGSKLILTPYFGLKGGVINQKMDSYYVGYQTSSYEITSCSKTDSWLLGPQLGCNSNYLLGHGFKISATASASLFYQKFKASFKQNIDETPAFKAKDKEGYITPNLEISLGTGWEKQFKNKCFLDISLAYSFLFFAEQNYLYSFNNYLKKQLNTNTESLTFDGITLSATFCF